MLSSITREWAFEGCGLVGLVKQVEVLIVVVVVAAAAVAAY